MFIKIKPISKETLEKNGWKLLPNNNNQLYYKKFNKCTVCVRSLESKLPYECFMPAYENPTPDDLIAIANGLKKLEENN